MRQTAGRRPYVGSAAVPRTCFLNARGVLLSRHGISRARSSTTHRSGFTLIEVTVALAILMIAVIALVASYGWYYQRLSDERVATIGQNLSLIHISEPTRLGMISYAVFCLKKKKKTIKQNKRTTTFLKKTHNAINIKRIT